LHSTFRSSATHVIKTCAIALLSEERFGVKVPHYPRLIIMLQLGRNRLNAAGEIYLTDAEAHALQAADFVTARTGWWTVRLPGWVVRMHNLPEILSEDRADASPSLLSQPQLAAAEGSSTLSPACFAKRPGALHCQAAH
jgi:hypothetical protein